MRQHCSFRVLPYVDSRETFSPQFRGTNSSREAEAVFTVRELPGVLILQGWMESRLPAFSGRRMRQYFSFRVLPYVDSRETFSPQFRGTNRAEKRRPYLLSANCPAIRRYVLIVFLDRAGEAVMALGVGYEVVVVGLGGVHGRF